MSRYCWLFYIFITVILFICWCRYDGWIIGDLTKRLCTSAELEIYLKSLGMAATSGRRSTLVAPNRNCNLSSWVEGCEPGWACSAGKDKVDPKTKIIPPRTENCSACCEGFFCPHGLTCMMRKSCNIFDCSTSLKIEHSLVTSMFYEFLG